MVIALVTKPRICKPQEVHPVFTLFTVMFTFKFSPDVFCSPLSFSPYLALVDLRKKEEWVFYRDNARTCYSFTPPSPCFFPL